MTYNWQKYNGWSICIIITLAVFLILYYASPNTDKDNARYILSAISQGLAAILALVFTITLVVAQMTGRYTAMDKIIFRPGTIGLMIIFGLGVVIPLLTLKTGFWGLGVNSSIALAVFCVFSLIPFLKDINSILKYKIGFDILYGNCKKVVDLGDEIEANDIIRELRQIYERAVEECCEFSLLLTMTFDLSEIGEKCAKKGWIDETRMVLYTLGYVGGDIRRVNNFVDRVVKRLFVRTGLTLAAFTAANGLKNIGVIAAEKGLEDPIFLEPLAIAAINGLQKVGVKADEIKADKKLYREYYGGSTRVAEDLKTTCVDGINVICMSMKLEDKNLAVYTLWWLGAFVTKYLPNKVDQVIQNLKEIEKEIGKDAVMSWSEKWSIIDQYNEYPQLEASFKDFKKQYNKNT